MLLCVRLQFYSNQTFILIKGTTLSSTATDLHTTTAYMTYMTNVPATVTVVPTNGIDHAGSTTALFHHGYCLLPEVFST